MCTPPARPFDSRVHATLPPGETVSASPPPSSRGHNPFNAPPARYKPQKEPADPREFDPLETGGHVPSGDPRLFDLLTTRVGNHEYLRQPLAAIEPLLVLNIIRYPIPKELSVNIEILLIHRVLSSDIFSDTEFAYTFSKLCAKSNPMILSSLLLKKSIEIPLRSLKEIEEVGALLSSSYDRSIFCKHYHIEEDTISHARKEYLENQKRYENDILLGGGGNCCGYTLAYCTERQESEDIAKLARFIQMAQNVSFKMPNVNPDVLFAIGKKILDDPCPFIHSEARRILGDDGANNPYLLGKSFVKNHKKYLTNLEKELEKCEQKIAKTEESAKEKDSPSEQFKFLQNQFSLIKENILLQERKRGLLVLLEDLLEDLLDAPRVSRGVPIPIMKKIGLKEGEALCSKKPLEDLNKILLSFKDHSGHFELSLTSIAKDEDDRVLSHAIQLSFLPASFRDPNDIDPYTLEPRLRSFASQEEMVKQLRKHLGFTYMEGFFPTFDLYPIRRVPVIDDRFPYNIPVTLSSEEVVKLKIGANGKSDLPEFADSVFECDYLGHDSYCIRRKKEEGGVPIKSFPFDSGVVLSFKEVAQMQIKADGSSDLPEFRDSVFEYERVSDGYRVIRKRKDEETDCK